MQALVTQGLQINRRHPDARGCIWALPMMEQSGDVVRDASRKLSNGLGATVWTGTRSWANIRRGKAVSVNSTNYIATQSAGTPWANTWSVMLTVRFTSSPGACMVRCGGFVFGDSACVLKVYTEAGASVAASTFPAMTAGLEYVVGARWRSSDNLVTFFKDGAKQDIAGAAIATSSVTTNLINWPINSSFVGLFHDVRIWDRYMPDAAFARYYANPNAFYTAVQPWHFKGLVGFNAGRFLPFMHPSFQS